MKDQTTKIIPTPEGCTAALGPLGDALYAIGGKWKLKIIIALMSGNKRFNELQRQVTGISAKVLSNELKEMELNDFVKKVTSATAKEVTEYELSDYSHTLRDVLTALSAWGTMHRQKITGRTVEQAPYPESILSR
ncbi:winged helix-turn-helix transcriptional regulator [Chitinophaga sp. 22321]|uniref:winged helix-turn-helix transcriptional regulator n=1 Tax=Chitinophaga TaxID=79328 RepID=UPI0031FF25EF